MTITKEERHCFEERAHAPHDWGIFRCLGQGLDGSDKVNPSNPLRFSLKLCLKDEPHEAHPHRYNDMLYWCEGDGWDAIEASSPPPETVTTQSILDARSAYGDKVQNQVEQAAMINAYLSGREVRPVDVPAIFMLVKLHRLGKMPDYYDSYADIEGYLDIAKLVVGADMIHATTAKEYAEIKARGNQSEGRAMESFMDAVQKTAYKPRHPYDRDFGD